MNRCGSSRASYLHAFAPARRERRRQPSARQSRRSTRSGKLKQQAAQQQRDEVSPSVAGRHKVPGDTRSRHVSRRAAPRRAAA